MSRSTVRVQVVLYGENPMIARLTAAIDAAAAVAISAGSAASVSLRIGDSSEAGSDAARAEVEQPRSALDSVGYEEFEANLGSAGGQNRLARSNGGHDVLAFLNPDALPAPTFLHELLCVLRQPGVSIAEARQVPFEHPKAFDRHTGDTSWASGGFMAVRAEAFHGVGGFDDAHFFTYCDDVDLSWRVRLDGGRVVHVPSAVVAHDKRLTAEGRVRPTETEEYHGLLGRLMLCRRYARPDLEEATIAYVRSAGRAEQRRALSAFEARLAAGRVPKRLEGAEKVACFVGGEYAPTRF